MNLKEQIKIQALYDKAVRDAKRPKPEQPAAEPKRRGRKKKASRSDEQAL